MTMTRRSFLGATLAGLGLAVMPRRLAAATTHTRLVFVMLRGGADALSLFSPRGTAWTRLQSLRGDVAMTTPVPYTANLYAHPALQPLLDAGSFGLVLHAGGMANTRSHFDQQYKIETGINGSRAGKGFLARTASAAGLETLAVDRTPPTSLLGTTPILLHDPARVQPGFSDGAIKPKWTRAQRLGMYKGTAAEVGAASIDSTARAAHADHDALDDELAGVTLASLTSQHGYTPSGTFAGRLALAARLTTSNLDPRLVTVDGEQFWDTHANQNTNDAAASSSIYKSIADLGTNLAALRRDLVARGQWSNTVVVVMSEFGRTVAANAALGTDHGRGGVMLLMGGRVRPITDSAYGGPRAWTLPSTVDESTPLALSHDYRTVVCEILQRHLGLTDTAARGVFSGEATDPYLNVLV